MTTCKNSTCSLAVFTKINFIPRNSASIKKIQKNKKISSPNTYFARNDLLPLDLEEMALDDLLRDINDREFSWEYYPDLPQTIFPYCAKIFSEPFSNYFDPSIMNTPVKTIFTDLGEYIVIPVSQNKTVSKQINVQIYDCVILECQTFVLGEHVFLWTGIEIDQMPRFSKFLLEQEYNQQLDL